MGRAPLSIFAKQKAEVGAHETGIGDRGIGGNRIGHVRGVNAARI